MNGKTKAITVIVVAVAICMLVYSPLTQANKTQINLGDDTAIAEFEQYKPENFPILSRERFAIWFLKNTKPTTVEGQVATLAQRKLVINTDDDQLRVLMPIQWTVNEQVITIKELFENHLEGQNIVIKVLEADMINKEGLQIYILIGYELAIETGIQANACTRINIED
ncbi:MAG: hypothetical protein P8Y18_02220 [Candidatus Bathyarchaeota archaeon]